MVNDVGSPILAHKLWVSWVYIVLFNFVSQKSSLGLHYYSLFVENERLHRLFRHSKLGNNNLVYLWVQPWPKGVPFIFYFSRDISSSFQYSVLHLNKTSRSNICLGFLFCFVFVLSIFLFSSVSRTPWGHGCTNCLCGSHMSTTAFMLPPNLLPKTAFLG